MTCPHCDAALSDRGSFCKACSGQVRCISCRALLEPGALACVECGKRIECELALTPKGQKRVIEQIIPALKT